MNFAWHMWHIIHTMFQKDSCSAHLWHLSTQCGPVNGMLETLTSSRLKTMPSLSTRFWVLDSDHGSVICSTLYTWSPATLFRVESKHIDIWWHLAHLALTLGRVWPSLAPGSCDARPSFVVELLRSMQKRSLDWFRQRCFAGKSKHLGRIAFHMLNVFREVLTDFFFAEMLCDRQEGSSYRDQPPAQVLEARQHAKTRSTNI